MTKLAYLCDRISVHFLLYRLVWRFHSFVVRACKFISMIKYMDLLETEATNKSKSKQRMNKKKLKKQQQLRINNNNKKIKSQNRCTQTLEMSENKTKEDANIETFGRFLITAHFTATQANASIVLALCRKRTITNR